MNARTSSRLAWVLAVAGVVLAVVGAAYSLASWHAPTPPQEFGFRGFPVVFALEFAATGLILATKRPENRIGWICLVASVFSGLQALDQGYAVWAVRAHGSASVLARLAAIGDDWVWQLSFGSLALMLSLFPNGRPLSRWWGRWISVGAIATVGSSLALMFTEQPLIYRGVENPLGVPGMYEVGTGLSVFFLLLLLTGVVSLVLRFRRSSGDEHEQMKWLAFSAAVIVTTFIVYWTGYVVAGGTAATRFGNVMETLIIVSVMTVPVAIGIGVTRYRLYDIDVVISKTVVYGALAAFIAVVYVAIVVGVGALVGSRRSSLLSAVAAGVVALAFQPARRWAQRVADRLVFGKRASPYEILSEFSGRLSQTYSLEDVTVRLARLVADGTGADRASVWLREGSGFHEVAATVGRADRTMPVADDGLPLFPELEDGVAVVHQGEVLGAISVGMPGSEPYTDAHKRLLTDVASQAGLALRNVRLIEELRESRRRIVTAQDDERRRIERNIHDGAQQQLVALSVKLRLAEQLAERDASKTKEALGGLQADTQEALETLRDLARGIYPPLLADKGLVAAIESQARKAALPVQLQPQDVGRYPQEVEAAVYFSVLEALQNVAKYAGASVATVRLAQPDGSLTFQVEDDGCGFDPAGRGYGTGLQGIADRLAALDGDLEVQSAPGAGTVVTGRIPVSGTDA